MVVPERERDGARVVKFQKPLSTYIREFEGFDHLFRDFS